MPIFDKHRVKRHRPHGGDSSNSLELEVAREEVPKIDGTMDAIDRALADTTPEALALARPRRRESGCGCWG